jgi:hypothetical protein
LRTIFFPFVTPISAALLKNGDLVVGNGDIGVQAASKTTNLLIEVSPVLPGGFVGQPIPMPLCNWARW